MKKNFFLSMFKKSNRIIDELEGNAYILYKLAHAIHVKKNISWVSKNDKNVGFQTKLLTVRECLDIPLPDTSWMNKPTVTRQSVLAWTVQKTKE